MSAYEIINNDGTISIKIDEHTVLGPYESRLEAVKALLLLVIKNCDEVEAGLQSLSAEDSSRSTILPPAA